ncbi:MAG TPA: MFS transporter [Streptosporangiaceae bacterium]|nr:MFS transporter [Streptosporangiaceae bacterium]
MSEVATAAVEPRQRTRFFRSPSVAVTMTFFIHGVLFASWTAHIPHVKAALRLEDGPLGIALLGAPVGSCLAMLLVARLLPIFGSRSIVRVSLLGYCAAGPFVGLAGSQAMLFVALAVWGAFQGTLDVSMNTQAIGVERRARRALMPGFHGSWSIGSFAGAGLGAVGVAIGISLSSELLLLATPCLLIGGWLTLAMIPDDHPGQPEETSGSGDARTRRRIWVAIAILGGIAIADMLCEGAAADWGAVYLRTSIGTNLGVAALAFTVYSLGMVTVRLAGNRLLDRFGAQRLLPALAALATVMFAVGLAVNDIGVVLIGFAGLGAGLGVVIPVVFSAAGRVPGIHPGTGVALVSACGWAGFMCGPVVIGQIAQATSLRIALISVPVLTAIITVSTAFSRDVR